VEVAGQLIHIFRYGLDYAFIRWFIGCGAYYSLARILVPAPEFLKLLLISKPMSLYRAGKVGPSPPLGVAMLFLSKQRQGSPNEPRLHSTLASRGDHFTNRTRVRKPYSSGSTCVVCLWFDSTCSGRQDHCRAEPAWI